MVANCVLGFSPLPSIVAQANSAIVLVDDEIALWFVSGGARESSWLMAVDASTGSEKWRIPFSGPTIPACKLAEEGFALVRDDILEFRRIEDGSLTWSTNLIEMDPQVGHRHEWIVTPLPSEAARPANYRETNPGIKEWERKYRVFGLGGTNVALFREIRQQHGLKPYWSDWMLFDTRSLRMLSSGAGAPIGSSSLTVLFRNRGYDYHIANAKVLRGPLNWIPRDRMQRLRDPLERLGSDSRIQKSGPSSIKILSEDGSSTRVVHLWEPIAQDESWWLSRNGLARFVPTPFPRFEGRSMDGKLLWKIPLTSEQARFGFSPAWLGEDEDALYFAVRNEVVRVVIGSRSINQVTPAPRESEEVSAGALAFAFAASQGVILEAISDIEWRKSSDPARLPPSQMPVRIRAYDRVTGKVRWAKSETLAIKRLPD